MHKFDIVWSFLIYWEKSYRIKFSWIALVFSFLLHFFVHAMPFWQKFFLGIKLKKHYLVISAIISSVLHLFSRQIIHIAKELNFIDLLQLVTYQTPVIDWGK